MRIDALALRNFRNYDALNVTFAPDCNVIVGENAQGKTNLLEAIVYLSSARSPRARAEKELISFGKSECSIKANAFARNRDFLLEIALAAGKRRKILINKVPVKKGSDLSDVLGAVYFCPEDLLLIRDGAAARRKFMDDALCQLRARYAQALSDYHRAYEHKTRILRDSEEYPSLLDTLPEFDLRMAQSGAVIIYYRARFCERLKEYARSRTANAPAAGKNWASNTRRFRPFQTRSRQLKRFTTSCARIRHRTRRRNGHQECAFPARIRTISP